MRDEISVLLTRIELVLMRKTAYLRIGREIHKKMSLSGTVLSENSFMIQTLRYYVSFIWF